MLSHIALAPIRGLVFKVEAAISMNLSIVGELALLATPYRARHLFPPRSNTGQGEHDCCRYDSHRIPSFFRVSESNRVRACCPDRGSVDGAARARARSTRSGRRSARWNAPARASACPLLHVCERGARLCTETRRTQPRGPHRPAGLHGRADRKARSCGRHLYGTARGTLISPGRAKRSAPAEAGT